jgi:hypothetical protein
VNPLLYDDYKNYENSNSSSLPPSPIWFNQDHTDIFQARMQDDTQHGHMESRSATHQLTLRLLRHEVRQMARSHRPSSQGVPQRCRDEELEGLSRLGRTCRCTRDKRNASVPDRKRKQVAFPLFGDEFDESKGKSAFSVDSLFSPNNYGSTTTCASNKTT